LLGLEFKFAEFAANCNVNIISSTHHKNTSDVYGGVAFLLNTEGCGRSCNGRREIKKILKRSKQTQVREDWAGKRSGAPNTCPPNWLINYYSITAATASPASERASELIIGAVAAAAQSEGAAARNPTQAARFWVSPRAETRRLLAKKEAPPSISFAQAGLTSILRAAKNEPTACQSRKTIVCAAL
jgi:hypothetical protein